MNFRKKKKFKYLQFLFTPQNYHRIVHTTRNIRTKINVAKVIYRNFYVLKSKNKIVTTILSKITIFKSSLSPHKKP